MKKKDHKENTKVEKNKVVDLNADNQLSVDEAAAIESEKMEQELPIEELPVLDEKALLEAKVAELESANKELNDKYLRLSAEFDNYRKRTLRERMELTKTAAESVMLNILPVTDDFERAMHSIEQGMDFEATKEGILLIYNKFKEFNKQNGITEIEAIGKPFDTDLHEALTKIPAPSEELKGKIIDVIQKGYYLNEKVIRFAKVVVGE
ncbi:MAG TPA: nucleotide exchange factor GrpE [Prolixibacteraceae bacterium]|nr:nucleotide exchange factor GrpE [Prolixibacteraceae bacterium]